MKDLSLYRRRIIPSECIPLKDDHIVRQSGEVIITTWNTLNPKIAFARGCSCYFLQEGFKVSKFYRSDGSLLYWYCDIVDYSYDREENSLTVTDLLADVIVYPGGQVKVVDLDELADALEQKLISQELLQTALRRLNRLLTLIYNDKFDRLQMELEQLKL